MAPVALAPIVRVIVVLAAHRSHLIASTDSSARQYHGWQQGKHHGRLYHGQFHKRYHGRHNEKYHERRPICYPIRLNSTAMMNETRKTQTKSPFAFAIVKHCKLSNHFISLKPEVNNVNNTLFSNLDYVLITNYTKNNDLNLATIYVVSVFCILYFYILFWLIIIIYYHGIE